MTFHQRRMQIRRTNRLTMWSTVFAAFIGAVFVAAAISGLLHRFC